MYFRIKYLNKKCILISREKFFFLNILIQFVLRIPLSSISLYIYITIQYIELIK